MSRFRKFRKPDMDSNFINNIIPCLRRFASNVEIKEALVDKIWEIYDDPENVHDYQFLRDNRLIMTHNGNVKKGKWEILPGDKLLIDREGDQPINLLYDFNLKGIILLKKTGLQQIPFILFDKSILPNGNIIEYLENLENKKNLIDVQNETSILKSNDNNNSFSWVEFVALFIGIFAILMFLITSYQK